MSEVHWPELEGLLERHWPPALSGAPRGRVHRVAERALWRALDARGWLSPWWPRAYGGQDWPPERQLAFQRICAAAAAPWPPGQRLGPALWRWGTKAQLATHLEGARSGSVSWAFALGEDLAALPARGGFLLSGTVPLPPEAEWLAALAAGERQPVFLLVELPQREDARVASFEREFVPASARLGGDGLEVARSIAAAALPLAVSQAMRRRLEALRALAAAQENGFGGRLIDDEAASRRFELLGVEIRAIEAMEERVARGAAGGLEAALAVHAARLARHLGDLLVDLLGYHALPDPSGLEHHNEPPIGQVRPEWVRAALASAVADGLPEWLQADALWRALEARGGGQ